MLGTTLKRLRERHNLTQERLADILGISRQAVCMWEAGKRELKISMLSRIAEIFGISVDELIRPQFIMEEVNTMRGRRCATINTKRKEADMPVRTRTSAVDFELMAPQAQRVSLTGDFNSWDEEGIAMKRSRTGLWRTSVNLKPGRYEYKFIVDGQWWTDPANSNIVTNAFGSQNSVKEVTL